jgi:mediator of RNA polymerase II transcription subunit 8
VEHLARNADVLNRTVAYPSTNYPGRTQEGLLGQLLRKKLEPQVETWVGEGREMQEGEDAGEAAEELWAWGREWIGQRVATYILEEAGDSYTVQERAGAIENVRVGLRRRIDEEESEEGDEEMEDVGVEVTTVGRTTGGQVEYGLEEVRKSPDGRSRSVDEILKFATSRPAQLVR